MTFCAYPKQPLLNNRQNRLTWKMLSVKPNSDQDLSERDRERIYSHHFFLRFNKFRFFIDV